jgi:hypothetical protein
VSRRHTSSDVSASAVGGVALLLGALAGIAFEHYRPFGTLWAYRALTDVAAACGGRR